MCWHHLNMYFREEQERDYYILGKQKAEKAQIFLKLLLKKYVLCDLGFLWFVVFWGVLFISLVLTLRL